MRSCQILITVKSLGLRRAQEGFVALERLEDIGLIHHFPEGVHGEHRHTRIDDLHAVASEDEGDGATTTRIYTAQLTGLEGYLGVVHDGTNLSNVLGISIV